jgi:hypothetical protein
VKIEFSLLKFVLQEQDVGRKTLVAYQRGLKALDACPQPDQVVVKTVLPVLQHLDYLWAYFSAQSCGVHLQGGRKPAIVVKPKNILGTTDGGQEDKNTGQKRLR